MGFEIHHLLRHYVILPENPICFFCDEMLTGLGRWLRIAGFDTEIASPGMPDVEIISHIKQSHRILLTCDTQLAEQSAKYNTTILLDNSDINACVKQLNKALQLDWEKLAFSRCSVCNSLIALASDRQIRQLNLVHSVNKPVYYCPQCQKLYWEGSHVKRMRIRLSEFNALTDR